MNNIKIDLNIIQPYEDPSNAVQETHMKRASSMT